MWSTRNADACKRSKDGEKKLRNSKSNGWQRCAQSRILSKQLILEEKDDKKEET